MAHINWGDNSAPLTTSSVQGQPHTYAADGTYTISVVTYFTYTGDYGQAKEVAAPACTAQVEAKPTTVTTGTQNVCDLTTGKITPIAAGPYDMSKYGKSDDTKCHPTVTVTSVTTPAAPAAPAALVNTGPGSVAAVFASVAVLGTAAHAFLRRRSI